MKPSLLAALLVACGAPTAPAVTPIALLGCSSPDAAVDSMSDSAPDGRPPVDWAQPWVLHTITTAGVKGADGVGLGDIDGDGFPDVVSGFEEGGGVTASFRPADPRAPAEWSTVRLAGTVTGYEDAKIGHFGTRAAIVGGAETNKLTAWLTPTDPTKYLTASAWTTVQLAALVPGKPAGGGNPADPNGFPSNHHFMQLALVDMDGDSVADVVYGTRLEPSTIGYFHTPTEPQLAASWSGTQHTIGRAGWVMSLEPYDVDGDGDLDLVVSDRASYDTPANWSLFGTRWLENTPDGFVNHTIAGPAGNGSPKFIAIAHLDGIDPPGAPAAVIEVRGDNASPGSPRFPNTITIWRNSGPRWSGSWTSTKLPLSDAYDLGTVQSVAVGDLDGDGVADLVIGTSYGHDDAQTSYRDATATNLAWLSGGDAWSLHPLLGLRGVKVDNIVLLDVDGDGDLDVIQSEQGDAGTCASCSPPKPTPASEQFGVFWLENPRL